jgi:CspA family cold shock protein
VPIWVFHPHLMKTILTILVAALAVLASVPVGIAEDDSSEEIRNTAVLESGTYQVTAKKVDPEEKEIYVTTADGKTLELYFSEATKLTQGGKEAAFDALKNGQKLEVQVEKDGNKLKPLAVTILE